MTDYKLHICEETRIIASTSLHSVLSELSVLPTLPEFSSDHAKISEKILAKKWIEEMRKYYALLKSGWYSPPQNGIGVLFGNRSDRFDRLNYDSFRPKEIWPSTKIFLDVDDGLSYFFASPVERKTGIIGDFGVTLYLGEDEEIIEYLKLGYSAPLEIFDSIETGMNFSEIYSIADGILNGKGLTNKITSITDTAGINFGHTIPWSYEEQTLDESRIISSGDQDKINEAISKKRIFINPKEKKILEPGMAITIEPRVRSIQEPELPLISYHTIGAFYEDGGRKLLTNFDELFMLSNMDYMYK